MFQIKILVYKKSLEEFIKVGEGTVQIEETFVNLFRVSLPEPINSQEEQLPG